MQWMRGVHDSYAPEDGGFLVSCQKVSVTAAMRSIFFISGSGDKRMTRKDLKEFTKPYRISDGKRFRLKAINPADTGNLGSEDKEESRDLLKQGVELLSSLQEKLYAQDSWALLLIFQAMDAAGKDSTIKHVMSGVNPQGCQVYSFKAPSEEELDHDYLWRTNKAMPERGRIGIFNRSYYEEVLVVRVHPELLQRQRIPPALVTKHIWKERYEDINAHERYLTRNGITIRKFFLHVSAEEQLKRLLARLEDPHKNWKIFIADVKEREYWDDYMTAYEQMIRHTSNPHAPWFVVPADNKWFTRLVVAGAIIDALQDMDLAFPKIDAAKRRELEAVRKAFEASLQAAKKQA
jgi:PPK2 family polyphosphate:nucleotide phosphotransferase